MASGDDDVLRNGVIVMENPRPKKDGIVNFVYEYGNPTYATMSVPSYLRTKPISGHLRDRNCYPLGQRILFKRNSNNEAFEAMDEGGFNFNEVRCVRGVGPNKHLCFVDLLEAVVEIGEIAMDVPPGVQFVAQLSIDLSERKQKPWPVIFAPYLLDEPDYSRKKQTVTVFPQFEVEYVGVTENTNQLECFRIRKEPKDYFSPKHSNLAILGPSITQLELKKGELYIARMVFSRLDSSVYTTHVEPWTARSYIPSVPAPVDNPGIRYARGGR